MNTLQVKQQTNVVVPDLLDLPSDTRSAFLEEVHRTVYRDRRGQYGPPESEFQRIADLWSALLGHRITARQVGLMMVLLKAARDCHKEKRDNLVDIAGYAACLAELSKSDLVEVSPIGRT